MSNISEVRCFQNIVDDKFNEERVQTVTSREQVSFMSYAFFFFLFTLLMIPPRLVEKQFLIKFYSIVLLLTMCKRDKLVYPTL